MEHKSNKEDDNSLSVVDVICKWYWGAAVGAGVGYLCGHAVIGVVVGAAVGFVLQMLFNSENGTKNTL